MFQYNGTTTTTDTPLNTTIANGNHTLSQRSTSPRLPTTTITGHTARMAPPIRSPNNKDTETDTKTMIIGICTAATLLVVISLVVALVILKKRRDQKQRMENIEDGRKNNNLVVKRGNTFMNAITTAVAKRRQCTSEEYDDVISTHKDKDNTTQSDDMTDNEEYEYVMVKRTSPQSYTVLGPRDTPDPYEQMQKNTSDKDKNSPYTSIKCKNWNAHLGPTLTTKAVYENQEEIIKDGYIVPVKRRENRGTLPSESYIEVLA